MGSPIILIFVTLVAVIAAERDNDVICSGLIYISKGIITSEIFTQTEAAFKLPFLKNWMESCCKCTDDKPQCRTHEELWKVAIGSTGKSATVFKKAINSFQKGDQQATPAGIAHLVNGIISDFEINLDKKLLYTNDKFDKDKRRFDDKAGTLRTLYGIKQPNGESEAQIQIVAICYDMYQVLRILKTRNIQDSKKPQSST